MRTLRFLIFLVFVLFLMKSSFGQIVTVTHGAGTGVSGINTGHPWTNPGNITTSNNIGATVNLTANAVSDDLYASNFGFSIPTNAVVTNIKVVIRRYGQSLLVDNEVRLAKNSLDYTSNNEAHTGGWATSFNDITYDGGLWGQLLWSPADINTSNFGVHIKVKNSATTGLSNPQALIDYVSITVTYLCTAIDSQSTNAQTRCQGVAFSPISVSGALGTLGYQWYQNANPSNSGGTLISGATSSTYTPSSTTVGTLYYYCEVTGLCGVSYSEVSGAHVVNPATAIASQSTAGQTHCVGVAFSGISVTATGSSLTYQWYSNTTASSTGGTLISGATSATYTPSASTVGTLYYYCVVTGTCGSATSAVSGAFVVNPSTAITAQSTAGQAHCVGVAYSPISVTASGTGLTYQWYRNLSANTSTGVPISGATASSYTPSSSTVGTSFYYCIVTGTCGSATSAVSGAFITTANTSITSQQTTGQTHCQGVAFSQISITASGTGLSYQWYSNTTANSSGGTAIGGATSATYTPSASAVGTLYYYCVVTGTCGSAISSVSGAFVVNPTTSIISEAISGQTVCEGDAFSAISVTASGTNLVYQWYSNTSATTAGATSLGAANGAQTSTYTPQASTVGTLYYYTVVTGACGSVTSNFSGAFVVNPAIVTNPITMMP
ncbi:MAG: hypothetical protein ACK5JD_02275 [Mangrovibacterium sp.]